MPLSEGVHLLIPAQPNCLLLVLFRRHSKYFECALFFFPNVSVPIVSLAVLAANTYFSAVHAGYIDGSRLLDHEGLAIGCKVSVLQLVTPNVVHRQHFKKRFFPF